MAVTPTIKLLNELMWHPVNLFSWKIALGKEIDFSESMLKKLFSLSRKHIPQCHQMEPGKLMKKGLLWGWTWMGCPTREQEGARFLPWTTVHFHSSVQLNFRIAMGQWLLYVAHSFPFKQKPKKECGYPDPVLPLYTKVLVYRCPNQNWSFYFIDFQIKISHIWIWASARYYEFWLWFWDWMKAYWMSPLGNGWVTYHMVMRLMECLVVRSDLYQ